MEAAARFAGSELDDAVAEHALSVRVLAAVGADSRNGLRDALAVCHLGLADAALDLEFADQAVNDNVKVQFSHAGDDGLARFRIRIGAEGGILLGKLRKRLRKLFLAGLGFGLDSDADDGLREIHGFHKELTALAAEGLAGDGLTKADEGGDIARIDLFDLGAAVRMHKKQLCNAFPLGLVAVENNGADLQGPGIDPAERELADEGIGDDLEGKRRERLGIIRMDGDDLLAVPARRFHRGNVERARKIIDDRVEKGLNALVAVGRTAADGNGAVIDRCGTDTLLQKRFRHFLAGKIELHQLVAFIGNGFDEDIAEFLRFVLHFRRDGLDTDIGALFVVINLRAHADEVYDPAESILRADGKLQRNGICPEALAHHFHDVVEIRPDDVHLVDIRDAGNGIPFRLTPNGLALGFNAAFRAEHRDRAVEHAEAALYLNGKVDMARRVDDVDAVLPPVGGRCCGGYGDAALALLIHVIHGGSAFVDLADAVDLARIEQDALRRRGFAGVDMRHDPDIAGLFKRCLPWHDRTSFPSF